MRHGKLTKENVNNYFAKTIALYNKGEYEEALSGFENLSEFIDNDLNVMIIPHIEKCKRIKKKVLTNSDKTHLINQAILKYFGWIDILKYITGTCSFIFFVLLTGGTDERGKIEGFILLDNIAKHPEYLICAIALVIVTFLIHKFMEKFTISQGLVRCKYCGQYTDYTNPNETTYSFLDNCSKCNRMYPMPNFYWDGWDGLEYMESRTSVPDEEFYEEYTKLKSKYSKEYSLYKKSENGEHKSANK